MLCGDSRSTDLDLILQKTLKTLLCQVMAKYCDNATRNTCHDATRGKKGFKCQHTLILYSVDFTSSLCHRLLLETSTLHSCCRFVPFHHMPEVMDLRSADCGGYFVTVNSLRVQEATLRLFELCKIACLSNGIFHQ